MKLNKQLTSEKHIAPDRNALIPALCLNQYDSKRRRSVRLFSSSSCVRVCKRSSAHRRSSSFATISLSHNRSRQVSERPVQQLVLEKFCREKKSFELRLSPSSVLLKIFSLNFLRLSCEAKIARERKLRNFESFLRQNV